MIETCWLESPKKISPGATMKWTGKWLEGKANISRFVFRPRSSALDAHKFLVAADDKAELPLGLMMVVSETKIGNIPFAQGFDAPLEVMRGLFFSMRVQDEEEICIVIKNTGSAEVLLDVGFEYEVVKGRTAATAATSSTTEPEGSSSPFAGMFTKHGLEATMHGLGVALSSGTRSLSGSLILDAAGSFIARCFEVLEQRLVAPSLEVAPRVEESVLPMKSCTIKPGDVGDVSANPQLPFQAKRWFLRAKSAVPELGVDAIDSLVVQDLYVGNFVMSAGIGDFPARMLTHGQSLAISTCAVGKFIRVRLRNDGKEEVEVGGYAVGEIVEAFE